MLTNKGINYQVVSWEVDMVHRTVVTVLEAMEGSHSLQTGSNFG